MEPYPYQRQTLAFVKDRHHSIVAHEPGLGKTMIAILAAELPALVICPASVRLHWENEIRIWRPDTKQGDWEVLSYADRDLFLMNPKHFKTVVVDEVHYVKNPAAKRSVDVCKLVRRIGRRGKAIALSGTLVPNRPIELWPILYAMRITDLSYEQFANEFAAAFVDRWGAFDVSGASNLPELQKILEAHSIRFLKQDVVKDLPEVTRRVISLDLPVGENEKNYSLDTLKRMRDSVPMEVMSSILQEQGERKTPQILEYCREALEQEEKIVVFCHHRAMIERVCRGLALFHPSRLWGGMTDKVKQENIKDFMDDPDCRVFVGQNQAAGTGVDGLQRVCSRAIIAEGSWVPSDISQMIGRLHRIGQTKPVLADFMTIERSIDQHMLRRCIEKQGVVDQVLPVTKHTDG